MDSQFENDHSKAASDTLQDLSHEDLDLIQEKVKQWKYAPLLLRGFVAVAFVGLLIFQFAVMGFSWIGLAVPGFLLLFWGIGEYLLRRLFSKLKDDLLAGKKRVVRGRLDDRQKEQSSSIQVARGTSSGTEIRVSYFWVIGGIRIKVSEKEYYLANEGDFVQVSMLPVSKIVFEAKRIS